MNQMSTFRRIAPLTAGMLIIPALAMAGDPMPQLDFGNPLLKSQVVWGALIFIVLYLLASKIALPKVGSVLEERAAHIARDLNGAKEAKTRADVGMTEAMEATAKARAEAQTAINAAMTSAKEKAAAQAEIDNARLEKRLQDAETQIAQARAGAMSALRQVASETAASVVTRLTGTGPDAQKLDAAIGAALSARGVG